MNKTALSSGAATKPPVFRRLCCAALVTLGLLAGSVPLPAHADEGNAIAEALFQEGRALMRAEQYQQAARKFEQSYKRDPKLGTLLNLAVSQMKQGRTATAWAHFKSAAAMAQRLKQQDRLKFARAQAQELEARLSRLRVRAAGLPADAQMKLDGELFEPDMLDTPLPLDPGPHTLTVRAAGKRPWSKTIELPAGPVEVPLLVPALPDAPGTAPGSAAASGSTGANGPNGIGSGGSGAAGSIGSGANGVDSGGGVSPLAIVGFSVGGAGLLVGAITGGMALGGASELEQSCPNAQCPEDQHSTLDSTTTLSHVSTVSLVIGGLGVGAGVIGLLLPADEEGEPPRSGVTLKPWLMPMGAGVRGTF